MNRSALRTAILLLGLVTALVHLVLLNILLGEISIPFTLNGLGYLGLLGAFFLNPSIVASRRRLLSYAFVAFAAVTILAWIVLGRPYTMLGYATKADEILLIAALAMNLKNES